MEANCAHGCLDFMKQVRGGQSPLSPLLSATESQPRHSGSSSSIPELIWIATRGVMENLGLGAYQSETQYLDKILREN
jgi:hypothetical protein